MGMSMMRSRPIAKGMLPSKYFFGGIFFWADACKSPDSESLHFNSSFAKSHTVSKIIPHLKGQDAPPKVSCSVMIAIRSSDS